MLISGTIFTFLVSFFLQKTKVYINTKMSRFLHVWEAAELNEERPRVYDSEIKNQFSITREIQKGGPLP